MDGLINSWLNTHWDRWKAPWMKKMLWWIANRMEG